MSEIIKQLESKGFNVKISSSLKVFKDIENMPFEEKVSLITISKGGKVVGEYQELFPFLSGFNEFAQKIVNLEESV